MSVTGDPHRAGPAHRAATPTAWWGMVVLITTEAMVFLALLAAYFFLRAGSPRWPRRASPLPELHRSVVFSVILLASSIPIFWMEHAL